MDCSKENDRNGISFQKFIDQSENYNTKQQNNGVISNELDITVEICKFTNVKYNKILTISYTVILVIAIFTIWGGLLIPLSFGLRKTKLPEDTRKYVSMLNSSLKENPQYLPDNCAVNENVMSNVSFNCSIPFVFNCTLCAPICGLWHPYGDNYYKAYRIINIIVALCDVLVTGIGILILIRVPKIFKFPRICYLFMFINGFIFSLLLAAAAILGPFVFFCNQRYEDHQVVADTPPLLVSFVGAIEHYTYSSFNLWFMVASVNIFLAAYFQTHAITKTRKGRLITFIIENIICWGIPAIFVIVYMGIYKQYTFIRLPQIGWPGNHVAAFALIILPLLLAVGTALTLISLTVYRILLLRVKIMTSSYKPKIKSHELRIIIFVILLWLTVVVIFIEASIRLPKEDIIQYELEDYLSCITLKENPLLLFPYNQNITDQIVCDSEKYKSYESPLFTTIGDFLLGMWAIILSVILTSKECRDTCKKSLVEIYNGLKTLTNKSTKMIVKQKSITASSDIDI